MRPIITLDEDHEVNEVFFDDVKVPLANLVGEENRGWTVAKYLLGHEHTGIARVGNSKRELRFLKRLALNRTKHGKPLLHDPLFAAKVAALEIELMALEVTVLRIVVSETDGRGPGPEASMLKIKGTEVQQTLTELMVEAIGPQATAFDPARFSTANVTRPRLATTMPRRSRRTTLTIGRRRSTAARTRFRRTSSRR